MHASAQWRTIPREPGPCVLVDIDGVLADASGRQHFLHRADGTRDWKGFFAAVGNDLALSAGPKLVELLRDELVVILLSARPGWVFESTVEWLERCGIRWDLVVLRGDDDHQGAVAFKRGVLHELRDSNWQVELAVDDDSSIIDMYRADGVTALYLHSGYYAPRTA